ncbi:DNA-binding response regulator [Bacillus sp. J14TS2]|uniref:response regulator transcription factor n=1 Tax=Bacillus sp. J14TS2 TaxID=2807188 RepID=UPI001B00759F|nr:response regulator transcription factor [Bacillus sp. J14TS2]GIN72591.1 DNA-binding response regulator [Bacillus sp. J14TS2]
MRKLLIIDDEPIIQEGLKHVIPWDEFGYEICDVGINGRDGLNKIRIHQPDLVMLDIRMPGLSGIDIISQLKKENFTTKFIILTAYSSFSYAKKLMGLGIEHYLLKPIVETELIQVLGKIEQERIEEQKLQDQLASYNKLNEEWTLRALLEGKQDDLDEPLLRELKGKELQLVRICGDLKQSNNSWLKEKVAENTEHIKLIRKDDFDHLLFIQNSPVFMKLFLAKMRKVFRENGNQTIVLLIASVIDRPEALFTAYKQIKELRNFHFCFSEKQILHYQEFTTCTKVMKKPDEGQNRRKLYHYIEFGDKRNIKKIVSELELYYRTSHFSKERIKLELFEWCVSLFDFIQENYLDINIVDKNVWENKINSQINLQSIMQLIVNELLLISESLHGGSPTKGHIVDKVKEYIHIYFNEDISLKYVANLFHYNSAYLGKLFKKETGEYFNVYLHQVRIYKAKELLMSDKYKVNEISRLVGYSNADYFYKNFKQYENMSPKEYQMKQRKGITS